MLQASYLAPRVVLKSHWLRARILPFSLVGMRIDHEEQIAQVAGVLFEFVAVDPVSPGSQNRG